MNSIEKINYFVDELNDLMSDELLFPNWEENGAGRYTVKTNTDGDFKVCCVEYRSTVGSFVVLLDKDYSSGDAEAFFQMSYLKLKRLIFFGVDSISDNLEFTLVDGETDLPICYISYNTLCKEGLEKLIKLKELNKQ